MGRCIAETFMNAWKGLCFKVFCALVIDRLVIYDDGQRRRNEAITLPLSCCCIQSHICQYVCVPILVVLYDECQGTTKKKAINADLLFSATLLLALFSCGFPTTNRCTAAVFYYAEELGHLGDHCHTSIICFWAPHNWYWKIPIYWQDFKNVWKSSQMSH